MKSHPDSLPPQAIARALGFCVGLSLLVLESGCVNLSAVRDFAQEASTLSAHRGVSDDLIATKERLYVYAQREPKPDDFKEVKIEQQEFDHEQQTLVKYMASLASLADNDVSSFEKEFAQAGNAASKANLLDANKVSALTSAGDLAARLATDYGRERKIRELVGRTDPAIQDLISKLLGLIRGSYMASLDTEKQGAEEFIREAKSEKIEGLSRLTDLVMRDHLLLIEARRDSAETYAKALERIARAHGDLAGHLGDFTTKEFIAQMKEYSDSIKDLRSQLKN
jgi:hypothetical protein